MAHRLRNSAPDPPGAHRFRYSLNTSTIAGADLDLGDEIVLAAESGYDAVEIWLPRLEHHLKSGGRLADLRRLADDQGIEIANAIGFAPWIVDDDRTRRDGLEQVRREMDMLAEMGCHRIAAPPAGAVDGPLIELDAVADRFEALLALGVDRGVMPQLEIWGFAANLHHIDQASAVASAVARPETRLLLDVYHLRRGGSEVDDLSMIDGSAIDIVHLNDYPASIAATDLDDCDRIYPGDGDAPLSGLIASLHRMQTDIALSIELFNRSLWEQDPLTVAKTGLQKMKEVVTVALG